MRCMRNVHVKLHRVHVDYIVCLLKNYCVHVDGIVHARYIYVHATIRIWQCIFSAIMIFNVFLPHLSIM